MEVENETNIRSVGKETISGERTLALFTIQLFLPIVDGIVLAKNVRAPPPKFTLFQESDTAFVRLDRGDNDGVLMQM